MTDFVPYVAPTEPPGLVGANYRRWVALPLMKPHNPDEENDILAALALLLE